MSFQLKKKENQQKIRRTLECPAERPATETYPSSSKTFLVDARLSRCSTTTRVTTAAAVVIVIIDDNNNNNNSSIVVIATIVVSDNLKVKGRRGVSRTRTGTKTKRDNNVIFDASSACPRIPRHEKTIVYTMFRCDNRSPKAHYIHLCTVHRVVIYIPKIEIIINRKLRINRRTRLETRVLVPPSLNYTSLESCEAGYQIVVLAINFTYTYVRMYNISLVIYK